MRQRAGRRRRQHGDGVDALADRMRGAVRDALAQATTVTVAPRTSAQVRGPGA